MFCNCHIAQTINAEDPSNVEDLQVGKYSIVCNIFFLLLHSCRLNTLIIMYFEVNFYLLETLSIVTVQSVKLTTIAILQNFVTKRKVFVKYHLVNVLMVG